MGRKSNAQKAAEAAAEANKAVIERVEQAEQSEESPTKNLGQRPELRDEERDSAMEELIARREKQSEPEQEQEPEKPASEPEAAEQPQEAEQAAEPEKPAEPEAPKLVKVKVDGEEFEVPQEEVEAAGGVAVYQREKAAENRLRRANETLSEAKKVQQQIAQMMEQSLPKQPTETDDQFIAARVEAIRFGTQEEASVALQEILSRTNKQVDPNVITMIAVNKIREDEGINAFKREFADIASNPLLLDLASSMEAKRKQALTQMPDWTEFYRSIGNEIRSVIGRPNQPASTPADGKTSQPDKEERKSSIVNLPTAASRAAPPEAQKPETREDVLNEMRKARGIQIG